MSTAEALKILNNNSTGRVYSEQEARLLLDFYAKLAKPAAKAYQKKISPQLQVA